jgi:hypothetical protein
VGDLLRVVVTRTLMPTPTTTVDVFTAGVLSPDGSPVWNKLTTMSVAEDLAWQGIGIVATGPMGQAVAPSGAAVVFSGLRRNGTFVTSTDLPAVWPGGVLVDGVWCLDGSCHLFPLPSHDELRYSQKLPLRAVHEAHGEVFGHQARSLYTPNRYEALAGGLHVSQKLEKFFVFVDNPLPSSSLFTPLYGCIDWRRDYHAYWLARAPNCAIASQPGGGQVVRLLGYVATDLTSGSTPLIHLRAGTQNSGTDDTSDHYYAVGEQDAVGAEARGYTRVERLGYVWEASALSAVP